MSLYEKAWSLPTPPPLHIHTGTRSGERMHVLEPDCWCGPDIHETQNAGLVIDHQGLPQLTVVGRQERAARTDDR